MRVYWTTIIIILTSCKSVELKRPVDYFWPITLHLGADISVVSRQLGLDTTKYSKVGFAEQLKQYKLRRSDLDKLNFNNNYSDSIKLYFYNNRLFSIDIFASGNRKVEYLKFDIKGQAERGLGLGGSTNIIYDSLDNSYKTIDTTFNYGMYRELTYRSTEGNVRYQYSEDIVENTAVLTILNVKSLKTMPRRKIH